MSELKLEDGSVVLNPTAAQRKQAAKVGSVKAEVLGDDKVKAAIASLREAVAAEGYPAGSAMTKTSQTYEKSEELIHTLAASLKSHGIDGAPDSVEALKAGPAVNEPASAFESSVMLNVFREEKALHEKPLRPVVVVSPLGNRPQSNRGIGG